MGIMEIVKKFLADSMHEIIKDHPCMHEWAVMNNGGYKCRNCDIEIDGIAYGRLLISNSEKGDE